jgi:hypothetical protein
MSVVDVTEQLAATVGRYRFAYLVTVDQDAQAHVVTATPTVVDGTLRISEPGRKTRVNLALRPSATVVWPPTDPDGYSLIVDGTTAPTGTDIAVVPVRAVLHRAASGRPTAVQPGTAGSGCDSDCLELPVTGSARGEGAVQNG